MRRTIVGDVLSVACSRMRIIRIGIREVVDGNPICCRVAIRSKLSKWTILSKAIFVKFVAVNMIFVLITNSSMGINVVSSV